MLTLGINPEDYETVFSLKNMDLYIGLYKRTDGTLITALQVALDELKQPGDDGVSRFERIIEKYLTGNKP